MRNNITLICQLAVASLLFATTLVYGQCLPVADSGSWDPNSASFDVASIRESRGGSLSFIESPPHTSLFLAQRVTAQGLIMTAYCLHLFHLLDVPSGWAREARYDIQAKSDDELNERLAHLSTQEAMNVKREMLRRLLADRFKLKLHQQRTTGVVYELITTSKTSELFQSVAAPDVRNAQAHDETYPSTCGDEDYSREGRKLVATHCSMKSLISYLEMAMETDVVDRTGLTASHAFTLAWKDPVSHVNDDDVSYTPMIQSVSEQLGLRLRRTRGPVTRWVVDQVVKPSAN